MNEEDLKATKIQVQVLEEILSYKDKEIERLNNIINKAIKRIYKIDFKPYQDEKGNYIVGMLTDKDMELLDILEYEGVDKDEN